MYSIPHKQFAIPRGYPIFFSKESMTCKGGGNVTTSFSEKRGGGYHFLGAKGVFSLWKHTPLSFLNQRGRGVYMKTIEELEEEIEMTIEYLAFLYVRLENAKTIEAGRQASAEILTEKLIERMKHD